VSTPTFTLVTKCTSLLLIAAFAFTAQAEWKVDFSRRSQEVRQGDLREPASAEMPVVVGAPQAPQWNEPTQPQESKGGFFKELFESHPTGQEIVVLNTDRGFVPSTIRVKRGVHYQIHIVNVNEKEKNVSFVLDSFSEHHATFYGKIKTFQIRPQKEGVFKFVSPETSAQGKLVVYPDAPENRMPASED
jgi:hypothetical protein